MGVAAVIALLLLLIANPSFETSLAGWSGYHGATLTRVSGGAEGLWSCQATGPASLGDFGIDDSPALVKLTRAGVRYTFVAWVKGTSGRADCQLREYRNRVKTGTTIYATPVQMNGAWQKVTATITALRDSSELDFQVRLLPTVPSTVFQVDAVSVTDVALPPPPPPSEHYLVFDIGTRPCPDTGPVAYPESVAVHALWVGPEVGVRILKGRAGDSTQVVAPKKPGKYRLNWYTAYRGVPSACVSQAEFVIPAPMVPLYGRPEVNDLRVTPK